MANPIPAQKTPSLFISYEPGDTKGKQQALAGLSRAYQNSGMLLQRSQAFNAHRSVSPPGTSVREELTRGEYDWFRPGEKIPTRDADILAACMQASERFPLVNNLINLMADFACKGIDVVHPRQRVEKFGKEWFARVQGAERSERIGNMALRAGVAIVRRLTARLPDRTLDVLRSQAADQPLVSPAVKLPPGEIPLRYSILDPRTLEVVGGELAALAGGPFRYAIKLPLSLLQKIRHPKDDIERELIGRLPPGIVQEIRRGGSAIPLDVNKTAAIYYKKDDFQLWPRPLLYPLLDALGLYAKMKQADRAALDSAISSVRLWTLGSLEHSIFPNDAAFARLNDVLLHNTGGGGIDMMWGPELTFKESASDAYKFLGMEKYIAVLQEIFVGLGVPPSLNGITGSESGFTNNMVSLKTLVERLQYLRQILTEFWMQELAIVQSVMGFHEPFQLVFDDADLSDQTAFLKLLIELADRDYISVEFLQEQFGAIPEIEQLRLRREYQQRKNGSRPPKAGPFHLDSQQEAQLERLRLQKKMAASNDQKKNPPSGDKGGRPEGARDNVKRKQKKVKPRGSATEAILWAQKTQSAIREQTQAAFLGKRNKKNLRQLTDEEASLYERFQFALASRFRLGETVSRESVRQKLEGPPLLVPPQLERLYEETRSVYLQKENTEPTLEEERRIRAVVLASWSLKQSNVESV